jgi:hypothetical protein
MWHTGRLIVVVSEAQLSLYLNIMKKISLHNASALLSLRLLTAT